MTTKINISSLRSNRGEGDPLTIIIVLIILIGGGYWLYTHNRVVYRTTTRNIPATSVSVPMGTSTTETTTTSTTTTQN